MEKNFNWREILDLHDIEYDFGTCQRADGSYYGHGGVQCHQGTEATPKQLMLDKKTGRLEPGSAEAASALTEKVMEAFPDTKPGDLNRISEIHNQVLEELDQGKITPKEIEKMIVDGDYYNYRETEFLFLGMEPGLQDISPTRTLAEKITLQRVIESGEMTETQAKDASRALFNSHEIDGRDSVVGGGHFVTKAVRNADQILGGDGQVPLDRVWANFNGHRVGSINMATMNANTVSDGKPGKPYKKGGRTLDPMDPNRSEYAYLASGKAGKQLTKYDRAYVKKNFADKRAARVAEKLVDAAENGKLKGGFAAPGGTGEYKVFKNSVLPGFEKAGRPVYQTSYTHTTGTGKTATHEVHVIDIGKGKYVVSASISLNRYGYDKVPNKIYRQAIQEVKTGAAKPYNSSAEKDLKERIRVARQDGRDGDVERLKNTLGAL